MVVRSLDRQCKEFFYQSWRRRWDLLSAGNANRPVAQQIGWLHDGKGTVPQRAVLVGRIIDLSRRNALAEWLGKKENCATAVLGLTFAYQPGDPASASGVLAAVSQLERMLEA